MLILWDVQNKPLYFNANLEHNESFVNWATNKYTCTQNLCGFGPTLQCYRINCLIFSDSITQTLYAWFSIHVL